jgi:hypothetical protein
MRLRLVLVVLMGLMLAACVAGPNPEVGSAADGEVVAGFCWGCGMDLSPRSHSSSPSSPTM